MRGHRLFGLSELDEIVAAPADPALPRRWQPGDPSVYLGALWAPDVSSSGPAGLPPRRARGRPTRRARRLELVVQRRNGGSPPVACAERRREQPVGEPRVSRQQRPVQVRPDRSPSWQPSKPVSPLFPNPARRGRAARRPRRASSGRRGSRSPPASALAGIELALEQHVADHAPSPATVSQREHAGARQLAIRRARGSRDRAAGSRRRRRARPRRRRPPRAAPRPAVEVGRDQRLLAVLAAAHVEQIVRPGSSGLRADRGDHELDARAAAPRRVEHGDVPPVGVDVQVVGVEVADARSSCRAPSTAGRAALGDDRAQRRASPCRWGGRRAPRPAASARDRGRARARGRDDLEPLRG